MGDRTEYCNGCRAMQTQTGENYDCNECSDKCPDIMPSNVGVWKVWSAVSTQWLSNASSIYGLNLEAALLIASTYGVTHSPALVRKLKVLETAFLEKHREVNKWPETM